MGILGWLVLQGNEKEVICILLDDVVGTNFTYLLLWVSSANDVCTHYTHTSTCSQIYNLHNSNLYLFWLRCLNIFRKWLQLLAVQCRFSSLQLKAGWWGLMMLHGDLIRNHQSYQEISLHFLENFKFLWSHISWPDSGMVLPGAAPLWDCTI